MRPHPIEAPIEFDAPVVANDNLTKADRVRVVEPKKASSGRIAKLAIMTVSLAITVAWTAFLGWGVGRITGLW